MKTNELAKEQVEEAITFYKTFPSGEHSETLLTAAREWLEMRRIMDNGWWNEVAELRSKLAEEQSAHRLTAEVAFDQAKDMEAGFKQQLLAAESEKERLREALTDSMKAIDSLPSSPSPGYEATVYSGRIAEVLKKKSPSPTLATVKQMAAALQTVTDCGSGPEGVDLDGEEYQQVLQALAAAKKENLI